MTPPVDDKLRPSPSSCTSTPLLLWTSLIPRFLFLLLPLPVPLPPRPRRMLALPPSATQAVVLGAPVAPPPVSIAAIVDGVMTEFAAEALHSDGDDDNEVNVATYREY